tara:strand:+ start:5585 stop:5875 length:291 start_codon:yes stop_codon:yes gene_type:complete
MNTNTGLEFNKKTKQCKLQEIKNSGYSKEVQIKEYMNYLYKNCDYRFPEFMLEWVAREHLDYKFTEEELEGLKQSTKEVCEELNYQEEKYENFIPQ